MTGKNSDPKLRQLGRLDVLDCSRRTVLSMTVAMYTVSIPVVIQHLNGLNTVLDKAAAWAAARKVNEADLLNMRLSPDMFNLTRQVRTALQGCRERSSIQRTQSQKPDGRNSMPTLRATNAIVSLSRDWRPDLFGTGVSWFEKQLAAPRRQSARSRRFHGACVREGLECGH